MKTVGLLLIFLAVVLCAAAGALNIVAGDMNKGLLLVNFAGVLAILTRLSLP